MAYLDVVKKVGGRQKDPDLLIVGRTEVDDDLYSELSKYRCTFAGGTHKQYVSIYLGSRKHLLLHQMVWILRGNELPKHPLTLDHKDQNLLNNKYENLREADKGLQRRNQGLETRNKTGYKGVYSNKSSAKPWRSVIKIKGKTYILGSYKTMEEAATAYNNRFSLEYPTEPLPNKIRITE